MEWGMQLIDTPFILFRLLFIHPPLSLSLSTLTMASSPSYTVRPATEADATQINAIVNYEIVVSVNNFNYGPRSESDGLLWLKSTLAAYPVLVAVTTVDGKEVIGGYSSLGSFRQKDGYRLYVPLPAKRRHYSVDPFSAFFFF